MRSRSSAMCSGELRLDAVEQPVSACGSVVESPLQFERRYCSASASRAAAHAHRLFGVEAERARDATSAADHEEQHRGGDDDVEEG